MRIVRRGAFFGIIFLMLFSNLHVVHAKTASKESAKAAILMDMKTGRPLYEKNDHEKLKIASITKVMTAVLAIESGKMNKIVKISKNASHMEGSSIYLKEGETIPLKDLVVGLMLRSGNDAATAIAEAVGGNANRFAKMMNAKAKELGMTDTHFTNPHGLDHPLHYSTAYDMALLTRYAMTLPEFRKIASTTFYHSKADTDSIDRYWRNKNKLLFSYPYVTGGKTGYTTGARRTLITTASKDGCKYVVVTLNDGNDWQDHKNLYNWAFYTFQMTTLVKPGRVIIPGVPRSQHSLYSHQTVKIPLSNQEKKELKAAFYIKPLTLKQKISGDKQAGNLTFLLDNEPVYKLKIYYKGSHVKPEGFWGMMKSMVNRLTNLGGSDD